MRKKPPDPIPLSLLFPCLSKQIPSVSKCNHLGLISQFLDSGNFVGFASVSASISDRFGRPLSSTIQLFGNPTRSHTSGYVVSYRLCSTHSVRYGHNLPCSGLGSSRLVCCSCFPWRLLYLDRSSSELLVVDGGFAYSGRGRFLIPTRIQVIRSNGPRSVTGQSLSPGRLLRSASTESFFSCFFCHSQVCYYLPIFSYLTFMEFIRALYLNAFRNIVFGSMDWLGLLIFHWLWCCLNSRWLTGVVVPNGVASWFSGWFFGSTHPHSLMYWELGRSGYSLVVTYPRHSRIARLLLNLFKLALNFFIDWACILVSRLCYLFSDTSLLCCCPGFNSLLIYNGLCCCTELGYCRSLCCIMLCFALQLTMAVFCPSWGKGVVWGCDSGLVNLKGLTMSTRFLLSFSCFAIVSESPISKYAVGHLVLSCHFPLFLLSGNCILNDYGKCLLYCTNLAFCEQFRISFLLEPICYNLCEFVSDWLWWRGLCFSNPYSRLPCMTPCLLFDPNLFFDRKLFDPTQHTIMCRWPVGMVDNPHGGWLFTIMMRILSSPFAAWIAFFVSWGLPLFWLSLLLERSTAPKHDPLWSRFCWQLTVFQVVWDEVKGKNPAVYEELLSETTLATFLVLSRGICSLVRWFGTGTWQSYSWQTRRAASRLHECHNVYGAIDSSVMPFTSSLCCSVGMYCSCNFLFSFSCQLELSVMFVVVRLQCNNGNIVGRIVLQCVSVFRLCPKALAQHRRMLRLALRGFDINSQFIRIHNHLEKKNCYAHDIKWTVTDQDWPKFWP